MALALSLGRRGQGACWPNPAVGCGDASTLCAVFSSLGFCEDAEKAEDMFEHCRRTCGMC